MPELIELNARPRTELYFEKIQQMEDGTLMLLGCSEKVIDKDGNFRWFQKPVVYARQK